MSETYLITGGAGFLGSNLAKLLLKKGKEVVIIDNLSTSSGYNLEDLPGDFEFIQEDIVTIDMNLIPKVDGIFHLASPVDPSLWTLMAPEILAANTTGTQRLLEHAGYYGIPFLFASSCEVYGQSRRIPLAEDDCGVVDTLGARASYEVGKRAGETLTWIYGKQFDLPVKIVRIFHAYGDGMTGGRLIPYLLQTALTNEKLILHGTGEQTRCFCYVEDVVEGLFLAMQHKSSMVLNMGSQHEVSVNEVAQLVLELLQLDSQIDYMDLPADDPPRRAPDISRAQEILHWQPRTTLKDGLEKYIEWYRNYLSRSLQATAQTTKPNPNSDYA